MMPEVCGSPKMPVVSVLITVYNGYPYIVKAIQSLINQTYECVEIVVVNDGSNDETRSELLRLSNSHENLKVIDCDRVGRGKALNTGLASCNGKYLAINDADDISLPERLAKQVAFLEENSDYVLVGSKMNMLNLKTGVIQNDSLVNRPLTNQDIKYYLLKGQPIQHSTVMMRTASVRAIGGYNENIDFLFDRDLFIRLMSEGKFLNYDEVLISLGRHSSQFFFSSFHGLKRIKQDFKYRLMAARKLEIGFLGKVRIRKHYLWSLITYPFR